MDYNIQHSETNLPNILTDYSKIWLHKVDSNDTLESIAKKYFEDIDKWRLILKFNLDRILNQNKIYPGLILRIPKGEELAI